MQTYRQSERGSVEEINLFVTAYKNVKYFFHEYISQVI
jgi:hypothetical protein